MIEIASFEPPVLVAIWVPIYIFFGGVLGGPVGGLLGGIIASIMMYPGTAPFWAPVLDGLGVVCRNN